jgi:predicted peptidase
MKIGFISILFIFLSYSKLIAQNNNIFEEKIYVSDQDTLPYRILYPENYSKKKKYPLVLFLHGAGQRGNDNKAQLIGIPEALTSSTGRKKYPCFILAPQCAKKDVWVNFPNFPTSLQATPEPTVSAQLTKVLLAKLKKELPIDKKRIYITGYSMGGEGAIDFLTRSPNLFAAAIPICSVSDTSKAKFIYHIPLWAFHGSLDDVNDVKYSRIMIEALKKSGGNPKYTEYPNVKHASWGLAYKEPGLFEWLFTQQNRR